MTDEDRLRSSIQLIDELTTLLLPNRSRGFLFFRLLSIKIELESQLNQLTKSKSWTKI